MARHRKQMVLFILVVLFWLTQYWLVLHQTNVPESTSVAKYFRETDFASESHRLGAISHHDARYGPAEALTLQDHHRTMYSLLASFAAFSQRHKVHFWLAHGTLLGWFWNYDFLPWDTDIDVQVHLSVLSDTLAVENGTIFMHSSEFDGPRNYTLDINRFLADRRSSDTANVIDARWIDMTNGKYIDITGVHLVHGKLQAKDGHSYSPSTLIPTYKTHMAGVEVHVPAMVAPVLVREYGIGALVKKHFHWHHFNRQKQMWEED